MGGRSRFLGRKGLGVPRLARQQGPRKLSGPRYHQTRTFPSLGEGLSNKRQIMSGQLIQPQRATRRTSSRSASVALMFKDRGLGSSTDGR